MNELLFTQEEIEFINSTDVSGSDYIDKYRILAKHFSLIPVHYNPDNKDVNQKPVESKWQSCCTTKRIFKETDFNKCNAGIACGPASNVIVLDIDDHDEFPAWLSENGIEEKFWDTFTVKSGGKSLHLYFAYPDDGIKYRCRGIRGSHNQTVFDIKGLGGQVIAPGSIHVSGKAYTVFKNMPISPAPQWVLDLASKNDNSRVLIAKDDRLQFNAIDHPQRQVNIFKLNIPAEQKVNILQPHAVGTRSEAEMSAICSLVRAKVRDEDICSIFEDPRYPIGEKHRETRGDRFKRLQDQIEKAKRLTASSSDGCKSFKVISLGEIMARNKQLEFLVEGLWTVHDTLMIFGNGGVGKSLLAFKLARQLADPQPQGFLGMFAVKKKCKVLFLQSEVSEAGYNNRREHMLEQNFSADYDYGNILFVTSEHDDIMISGDFNEDNFFRNIKLTIEEYTPDVLVIDPLISFHNEDENANTPMRRLLDRIKLLGHETKTSILIVHHSGKSAQGTNYSGGRGASSIGDWASSSIELKRIGSEEDSNFELIHKKARDFASFGTIKLHRNKNLNFELQSESKMSLDSKDLVVIKAVKAFRDSPMNQNELAEKIREIAFEKDSKSISKGTAISWIKVSLSRSVISQDEDSKSYKVATEL